MPMISKFAFSILHFALKFSQFFKGLNCYKRTSTTDPSFFPDFWLPAFNSPNADNK